MWLVGRAYVSVVHPGVHHKHLSGAAMTSGQLELKIAVVDAFEGFPVGHMHTA